MYKINFIIVLSSFLLFSCNNDNKKQNKENQSADTEVTIESINSLEGELFEEEFASPDIKKAKKLIGMYISYANQNPKDTISPNLLFKAADISMNLSSAKNTLTLFNRLIKEYPNYRNISTVMFLKGFVYEDQLKDYANASKCYNEFIAKYPNSDFADDALVSLNNLGKSPEELIKEFEEKNK